MKTYFGPVVIGPVVSIRTGLPVALTGLLHRPLRTQSTRKTACAGFPAYQTHDATVACSPSIKSASLLFDTSQSSAIQILSSPPGWHGDLPSYQNEYFEGKVPRRQGNLPPANP